jgi:hypothetical protein
MEREFAKEEWEKEFAEFMERKREIDNMTPRELRR